MAAFPAGSMRPPKTALLGLLDHVLRAELDHLQVHWNTVRLHAGVGYVTQTMSTPAAENGSGKDREAGMERARRTRLARHHPARASVWSKTVSWRVFSTGTTSPIDVQALGLRPSLGLRTPSRTGAMACSRGVSRAEILLAA